MSPELLPFIHIFVDHSNIWGGARLASQINDPGVPEKSARISVKHLDPILGGHEKGVSTKIVSGGIPPGMEPLWAEYQGFGYDTQRLFRGQDWRERGVDHTIIGHMWRLLALHKDSPTALVLASGDGKKNEFGTSFFEVLYEILTRDAKYPRWHVRLASFDWNETPGSRIRSPTNRKMKTLVSGSSRGTFVNLMDHYSKLVYHQKAAPERPLRRF